jgi:SAM-dependent methyltransferase
MNFDMADVRRYYDRRTRSFIRFGQGGRAGAIHRAVWGPGVTTREQAFHYVDDLIADLVHSNMPKSQRPTSNFQLSGPNLGMPHLVDLGCGVGGSLCYLAERLPIRGTGITLSPVQARLAARRIRHAGLADRLTCIEADYCAIPSTVATADLAFAIESFVHGPDANRMLTAWARLVRPGGVLVVCDDFSRSTNSGAAAQAIDRFGRGWRINTLLSRNELQACARVAGFDHEWSEDLSPLLELRRARDRVIEQLGAVAAWFSLGGSDIEFLQGGSALQQCLAEGWIGYDFSVFRRRGEQARAET